MSAGSPGAAEEPRGVSAEAEVVAPDPRLAASGDHSSADVDARPSLGARLLLAVVHLYRLTAPMRTPRCRFWPSCSSYAVEALRVHGAAKGTWLAMRRVGRCHPWNPGGIDPVPPRE